MLGRISPRVNGNGEVFRCTFHRVEGNGGVLGCTYPRIERNGVVRIYIS